MLPGARLASFVFGVMTLALLPMACSFPDYGGFGQTTSSSGQGGSTSSTGSAVGGGGNGGGNHGCNGNDDCAHEPGLKVCDDKTHRCVACTPADDTCPMGNYCALSDLCEPGCKNDSECNPKGTVGGLTCDKKNHLCLGCTDDDQCPAGLVCEISTTTCIPGCTPTHDCGAGHSCCGTTCSDLTNDVMHCGGCDTPCAPANGTGICEASQCKIDKCNTGFHDCDGDASNGCESDAANDPDHCGTCDHACPMPANAAAACQNGTCGLGACNPHFGDCDAKADNGCEVNLDTSAPNCGGCGLPCSNNHGTPSCATGQCAIACDAGFKDCDGDITNGCEVDTTTNVNNCSSCNNVCAPQGGTPACVNSQCTVSTCAAGKGDCDGNAGNGCEANLTSDPNNCGGCGLPCAPQNATGGCSASMCRIQSCNAGFQDCDGLYATGCEVNTQTSSTNCGSCGNACTNGHGTTSCKTGTCTPVCSAGFSDCDADPDNGCETNLNTDPLNCGMCGKKCTFANGTGACQAGTCVLTGCNLGFADCDLVATNGCEVPLNTTTNCGQCGRQCTNSNGSTTCLGGACTPTCAGGFSDCDMNPNNGCETGTATDLQNCGSCGAACSTANGTASCTGGNCSIACTAPFQNCDGNARTNGCEANTNSDSTHCGTCNKVCSGATPFCVGGACSATACPVGKSDCDNNMGNGCECSSPGCCGSSCQSQHTDGFGQAFYDCTAPHTLTAVEALEACAAATGDISLCSDFGANSCGTGTCTQSVVCSDGAANCQCWTYNGAHFAGNAYDDPTTDCFCSCVATAAQWF